MRKTCKLFILLLTGVYMAACSEDFFEDRTPIATGDEIVFGANASVASGNKRANDTRTSFGDVDASNAKIAINWSANDMIDIACPEAVGTTRATYKIPVSENGKPTALALERVSLEAGLQWNGAGVHNFYGAYPSAETFKDGNKYPMTMLERPNFEVNPATKTAKGFMPMNYTARDLTPKMVGTKRHYMLAPNMDYAFMVAHTASTLEQASQPGSLLTLNFEPLSTILEFDITANTIGLTNTTDPNEIQLDRVELVAASGQAITGNFSYDFATKKLVNTDKQDRSNINLFLRYEGMAAGSGVKLRKDDVCTVNFFLMTDRDIAPKDLKVKIYYTAGTAERFCTATLGTDIKFKHKYVFRNFRMPEIKGNLKGSTWFTAVDDDVYMNQISMICAGNAFSNDPKLHWFTRQQVMDYTQLWDKGIRAFEFVTQSCARSGMGDNPTPIWGLKDEHFVCGEIEMDGLEHEWCPGKDTNVKSVTFGDAFMNLAKFLIAPEYKDFHRETLIIIARYHAVCDGYNPERYVRNLTDFLDYVSTTGINGITIPKDRFVLLNSNSTAGDLKGKIAIVVRPGDDDYCAYLNVKSTSQLNLRAPWNKKLCFVQNWGSAYDRWDTRFAGVAREATWNKKQLSTVEANLWAAGRNDGISNGQTEYEPLYDCKYQGGSLNGQIDLLDGFKDYTTMTPAFNFNATINGKQNSGYIQEWGRVIPDDLNNVPVSALNEAKTSVENFENSYSYTLKTWKGSWPYNSYYDETKKMGTAYLWYKWPGSYQEKMDAIKNVFQKSVTRTGAVDEPFCINVLSGYFADKQKMNSLEPFIDGMNRTLKNVDLKNVDLKFNAQNQGNGGNYAALACHLNKDVFEYLKSPELQQGPWGLVQMDYLGATATDYKTNAGPQQNLHGGDAAAAESATISMMKMFITNNFSFPLVKRKTAPQYVDVQVTQTDEVVVSE